MDLESALMIDFDLRFSADRLKSWVVSWPPLMGCSPSSVISKPLVLVKPDYDSLESMWKYLCRRVGVSSKASLLGLHPSCQGPSRRRWAFWFERCSLTRQKYFFQRGNLKTLRYGTKSFLFSFHYYYNFPETSDFFHSPIGLVILSYYLENFNI